MCSSRKSCPIEALSQREQETLEEEEEEEEEKEVGRRRRNRHRVVGTQQGNVVKTLNQIANNQYCNSRETTHDTRTRSREEVEERGNKSVTCSVVFKFEWLLMETICFIVAKTERISRSHVKWTSYRKLRRCKKLVNCYLTAVYINLLSCLVIRHDDDLSEHQQQQQQQKSCNRLQASSDTISDTSHVMKVSGIVPMDKTTSNFRDRNYQIKQGVSKSRVFLGYFCILLSSLCLINELSSSGGFHEFPKSPKVNLAYLPLFSVVDASLIIGDSAIEIQEVGDPNSQQQNSNSQQQNDDNNRENQQRHQDLSHYGEPSLILGSTSGSAGSIDSQLKQAADSLLHSQKPSASLDEQQQQQPQNVKHQHRTNSVLAGPLPPIAGGGKQRDDDITDGDKKSRNTHDYEANDLNGENNSLNKVTSSVQPSVTFDDKAITGKVVDFELTPAGGHNKAKIKKKKKKKKMMEEKEFKKWGKKKKSEKKAHDKKMKESMKKKKEEGKVNCI